ncbi:hypothetical protein PEX2_074470 [Penicillium expansum]|uniref:Uncharacterized protein n=1 Tax=Penicillium expansum TaxID=27334 RepID=A0A0A2I6B4_PENEN|nr:hypothetical protein PEX2_074470 [Penicillium expansum]KGO38629.1 hypothetical protein PEXP_083220 [Penicillium expansum]KGO59467.1 hypothetical protein PEX2_074470 [Penicillium expansum]
MKAFKLLLFIFLSLLDLGQASKLAAPSEMLAMYNTYVLDFVKNGATRTLGPGLGNEALVDFGTFVSHVYESENYPRTGVFLSKTPQYSQDTLSQIRGSLGEEDNYGTTLLLRGGELLPKSHRVMLEQLSDVVKSTRGSTAPGFSDAWKAHLPEFRRALAGTQGARLSEMFSVGLKPMFEEKYKGATLMSSPIPVLDTDVSYDRANWGLTLTANGGEVSKAQEYKTWYVGLQTSKGKDVKSYLSHQKITNTIGRSLTELDSLDSCD